MAVVRGVTIGDLLSAAVDRHSQSQALEYHGKKWSYCELDEITDGIAKGLMSAGVMRGSHVGIWANDRPNTVFCLYAVLKLGAVAVMLGASRTGYEISARLSDADVDFLLFDDGIRASFPEILRRTAMPPLRRIVYIGEKECEGFLKLEDLCAEGNAVTDEALREAKAAVKDTDPDMILFTSGTSGAPKGVVTTHFSRVNSAIAQAAMISAASEDRFCSALPMFHCFSLTATVMAALAAGACLCIAGSSRTTTILRTIERSRCTVFTAVPTLFSAILARPDIAEYDLSSLRTGLIGGSVYPPKLFERICRELDYDLLPSLGQTEATAGITAGSLSDSMEVRSRTVGRFLPDIEGTIKDIRTGFALPDGADGEICIRGYNVMQGYYKRPDLTSYVIDADGWLHTGDLGRMDHDGNIHLNGRIKELIIRGGENIAPAEVENAISADERVQTVKVVGVPDPHYMEELCACVVVRNGCSITDTEIRETVAAQLAEFKVPRYVLFVEKLPATGSGKINSAETRKMAIKNLQLK